MEWKEKQSHLNQLLLNIRPLSGPGLKNIPIRTEYAENDTNSKARPKASVSSLAYAGWVSSVTGGNLLDTLCAQLEKLMSFQPGERDLVMLQHKFVVEWANGKSDKFTSTLELLGNPKGYSAMSFRITCGIATQLLLDGHPALNTPGVLAPYMKEICDPIREILRREGVELVEKLIE
ncbi:MAG: hypothetical protein M1816_001889 [Peltula sp. TS41687]|nr:MAG: hypothetical protein M1816_001889 [Peltula sp. TS41687]